MPRLPRAPRPWLSAPVFEALPTRALKAELAARGVSVLGLSERRELVEVLLSAPPVADAAVAAAAVPAAATAVAKSVPSVAATGQLPANIWAELSTVGKWIKDSLAANLAAAERGNAAAQGAMGDRCYSGNLGVPQDFVQAARWFRKAADQGFAHAQFALGSSYAAGKGVPR